MAHVTSLQPGTEVLTPRGAGRVHSVSGIPGAEVVVVAFDLTLVDFVVEDVWVLGEVSFHTLRDIEEFLAESPGQHLQAIEQFLTEAAPPARPEAGGKTRGAVLTYCTCACGEDGGCYRLSTAPDMHRLNTNSCVCERSRKVCPCA